MRRRRLLAALVGLAAIVAAIDVTQAHKPITSKYTYNRDLFPIFRDRCGSCHAPGGVGPMSLLTYAEARPWAQSIKEEVVHLRMPPRYAEPGFGPVRNGHGLTAREIDTIVEWANGGTPEGDRSRRPRAAPPSAGWSLGEPDLTLTMPEAFTLAKDAVEETRYFVVPTHLKDARGVRAVDVQPGAREIVRSVLVYVDAAGKARERDRTDGAPGFAASGDPGFPPDAILAAWMPGQPAAALDARAGFPVPAGSDLVLRIRYKKTWLQEGSEITDQTLLGLYFAAPSALSVEPIVIAPPRGGAAGRAGSEITIAYTVPRELDLVALVPMLDAPAESVRVEAVRPDGAREPLLFLSRPTPVWPARYWLDAPVALPKGTKVEVTATFEKPSPGAGAARPEPVEGAGRGTREPSLHLRLDCLPAGSAATVAAKR